MDHSVALVLGGGRAAGQAWEIGVIAGLAEAGLDMTEAADLVAGTSAGATTAAQVRSGLTAAELLASVMTERARPAGQVRQPPPSFLGRDGHEPDGPGGPRPRRSGRLRPR